MLKYKLHRDNSSRLFLFNDTLLNELPPLVFHDISLAGGES